MYLGLIADDQGRRHHLPAPIHKDTNVRPPESLDKEKYLSTVCDVVEILFETLEETNIRPPESLAKEKYLSSV